MKHKIPKVQKCLDEINEFVLNEPDPGFICFIYGEDSVKGIIGNVGRSQLGMALIDIMAKVNKVGDAAITRIDADTLH